MAIGLCQVFIWSKVFIIILLCSSLKCVKFSLESISEVPSLLQEGKEQFNVLKSNAGSPRYGACWSDAVSSLQVGCRSLTQELQSALAFQLTNCFLQMSGQGPVACAASQQECLRRFSDREFNAYTEFYTHTQNICYFLQSKLWHERSEKTIDMLSTTSFRVSQQLVEAEKGQEALLQQQRESLSVQENMALHMAASKETLHTMMEELRVSALDQQLALSSLFQQLSSLQSWAVGELSWFDSIIFYSTGAIMSCLFTSVSRTQLARLPLLVVLSSNYVLERYWCGLLNDKATDSVLETTDALYSWIWFFRKISITICVCILLLVSITYCDYNVINYHLLVQLRKQNSEMREMLTVRKRYDVVDSSVKHGEMELCKIDSYDNQSNESVRNDTLFRRDETPVVFSTDWKFYKCSESQKKSPSLPPVSKNFSISTNNGCSNSSLGEKTSKSKDLPQRRSQRLRAISNLDEKV